MFFKDHEPPHFHADYGGWSAAIRIDPPSLLSGELPARGLALAIEWATLRRAELLDDWRRVRRKQHPIRIPPLE
jgi:hypothetical protein